MWAPFPLINALMVISGTEAGRTIIRNSNLDIMLPWTEEFRGRETLSYALEQRTILLKPQETVAQNVKGMLGLNGKANFF